VSRFHTAIFGQPKAFTAYILAKNPPFDIQSRYVIIPELFISPRAGFTIVLFSGKNHIWFLMPSLITTFKKLALDG